MTDSSWSTYRRAAIPLASFLLMGLFWGAWAALVPEVQQRTQATPPELGLALLWAGGGALPAMLVTGRLWPRFGRGLVSVMLLFFGLAAVLPALAPNVFVLGVAMALVGASSGALDVAMNSEISDIEAATGRRLMYLAHALFSLAVLVASLSAGLLRELEIGPLPVLGAVSVCFLAVALPALAVHRGRSNPVPAGGPFAQATAAPIDLRRTVALLGLLCAGAFLIEDAMMSWSALHLERSLGASPAVGGAGPGLFAAAMFTGRSLGQILSRHFAERDLLVGSGTLAAAGIALAAWSPIAELALFGLVVAGSGVSLAAPALFSRAGRLAGDASRGAAVSTLTTLGYVGFVIGPPTVGLIAGLSDLRVSFSALALLAVGLAVTARLTIPPGKPGTEPEEELPPVARA